MAKIKIDGLDKLQKALKEKYTLDDVKHAVRRNGAEMQSKMQVKADFHGHFKWQKGRGRVFVKPTGATKESIRLDMEDGGFTAEIGPTTEYSPYVEYGTRYMEAQPFVRPAYEEQVAEFKRDMRKLVR